jgi:hypothetical protein
MPGVPFPVKKRDFSLRHSAQTGCGAQAVLYIMGKGKKGKVIPVLN